MNKAYLLQHSYEKEVEGVLFDETKIIGIYSTKDKAEDAIKKYRNIQGFKDYPDDFYIDGYPLDKEFWADGFISWKEEMEDEL